jgi:uncharacterized protein YcbX
MMHRNSEREGTTMNSASEATGARIAALYRYPVKGLSAEPLDRVSLEVGGTMPLDRAWAIENGPGRFDPENPKYLAKIHFLMLMRDERLATLETRLEADGVTLVIRRDGKQVARGNLATPIGRQLIEQFMAAYMQASLRGAPKIVAAPGHSFSDMAAKCLHIVNLASVRDLERIMSRQLDPLRFRPNVLLDGVPAWQELGWLEKPLTVGATKLRVFHRTRRCDATNVDPKTGVRDTAIPAVLQRSFGHSDFGIYARVETAGAMAVGDPVRLG